mmetsp:Transcript_26572/g.55681  ORF Transcript_26572/g.55681 Transcript_26572/m.55681 type:complete len:92 (-) Transcript_26572:545-820(-)
MVSSKEVRLSRGTAKAYVPNDDFNSLYIVSTSFSTAFEGYSQLCPPKKARKASFGNWFQYSSRRTSQSQNESTDRSNNRASSSNTTVTSKS